MQKVMDILPKMVESLGIQKKYKVQLILFYWNKIVGSDIAAQSVPVSVEYGVLFLAVPNSVWCHHLSMMKADLVHKVNQFVGEALVRDIRFKNHLAAIAPPESTDDGEAPTIADQLKSIRLDAQELASAAVQCEEIADNRLKHGLLRLYQKHLRFNKFKKNQQWQPCLECGSLCPPEKIYCHVCEIKRREVNLSQIRRSLEEVPWATYADINQYIPCTAQEYINAKVMLLHRLAGALGTAEPDSLRAKTLTMLFTGAKHDELNARLIQKTLAKFRRNPYVSTLRR